jgi:hypothetical protein
MIGNDLMENSKIQREWWGQNTANILQFSSEADTVYREWSTA